MAMTSEKLKKNWDTINLLLEEANKKGAFTLQQSKQAADALLDLYPDVNNFVKYLEVKERKVIDLVNK